MHGHVTLRTCGQSGMMTWRLVNWGARLEALKEAGCDGFRGTPRGPYEGVLPAFSGPWPERCGVQVAIYGARSGRGVENLHSAVTGFVLFLLEPGGHW